MTTSAVSTKQNEQSGLKLAPWPRVDFSSFGEVEFKPLTRVQKLAGDFLSRNWVVIPHVTHHDDADITDIEVLRKRLTEENPEVKLTPLVYLVKAVVAALKAFPVVNASLDLESGQLILKKYFHIGMAVDTPNGLLVAVLRDCDKKGWRELSDEILSISTKAREKGLSMQEMSGGCFTISSLGSIGGTGFTPIINAPEVAILGVSKVQLKPRPDPNGDVEWRKSLPLSLSYDHRVLNGADAARFTAYIAAQLAEPEQLLMD